MNYIYKDYVKSIVNLICEKREYHGKEIGHR